MSKVEVKTMERRKTKRDYLLILAIIIFIFLATAPIYMPMFRINLLGKYVCFAMVAIALDMIWGYTGILSLGHGVYFGIGAYCMAMYLNLEAAQGGLPEFMKYLTDKLPIFWEPFKNPLFAIAAVILLPIILAVIIGYLTFLNRIKGVYFSILSQALAMILFVLLSGQTLMGGSNGLNKFSTIFGADINSGMTKLILFYVSILILIVIFFMCRFLTRQRIGKVLIAIRDGENRARFTGYDPATYKVFVYALSAAITGIAGALFVTQVGIISPKEVDVASSVEMIIWVAIGGKGTLVGPLLGALGINGLKTSVSESFPDFWPYFIGFLFVIVILWLPGGIISLKEIPGKIKRKFGKRTIEETEVL